jgi:hypothetical protein
MAARIAQGSMLAMHMKPYLGHHLIAAIMFAHGVHELVLIINL